MKSVISWIVLLVSIAVKATNFLLPKRDAVIHLTSEEANRLVARWQFK
jgi:hypothetical protein